MLIYCPYLIVLTVLQAVSAEAAHYTHPSTVRDSGEQAAAAAQPPEELEVRA